MHRLHIYVGEEGKGSAQLSNMITDGYRTQYGFVCAGKVPVVSMINH